MTDDHQSTEDLERKISAAALEVRRKAIIMDETLEASEASFLRAARDYKRAVNSLIALKLERTNK